MGLAISSVLELKRLIKELMVMSFHGSTQANGVIQGERSTSVGSDAMVEMVLLFFYRLMFGRLISGERGNEVSIYTSY